MVNHLWGGNQSGGAASKKRSQDMHKSTGWSNKNGTFPTKYLDLSKVYILRSPVVNNVRVTMNPNKRLSMFVLDAANCKKIHVLRVYFVNSTINTYGYVVITPIALATFSTFPIFVPNVMTQRHISFDFVFTFGFC